MHARRRSSWILLSVLVGSGIVLSTALASAQSAPRPIEVGEVDEFLNPRVSVSGGVRAGVMAGDPEKLDEFKLGELYVYIPRKPKGMVCVELTSRDGRYSARFEVPGLDSAAIYQITFETEHADDLQPDESVYLTALVTDRAACESSIDAIFLASWRNDLAAPIESFAVLLNAGRLKTKLVASGETKKAIEKVTCEKLEDSKRVAFDTKCTVLLSQEVGALGTSGGLLDLDISRERHFNKLPPVPLPVALGDPTSAE